MPAIQPEKYTITASIVTYNNSDDQLANILAPLSGIDSLQTIVVDNSPQSHLKHVCEQFNHVTYYHTPQNPGFGASHNFAFYNFENSDIHLVINPDVSFKIENIIHLINYLADNPDVSCIVPKVLYPDGSLQRLCKLLPSPLQLFSRRFLKPIAKFLDYDYELQWFDYNSEIEIPSASGCFMAIRSSAFRKIRGFDSHFFMYMEDVDLTRRLAYHGKIIFTPNSTILHEYAKSSYKNKKLLWIHIKSSIYYFSKWGWLFDNERYRSNNKILKYKPGK